MSQRQHLVDSHFHSEALLRKGVSPEVALTDFFASGGEFALDVAIHPRDWKPRLALAQKFPGVRMTAGVHPGEADRIDEAGWVDLEIQLKHPLTVALGEVGLDWYRGRDTEGIQRDLLHRQLTMARGLGLPVVLHNREADLDVLFELDRAGWENSGVFHCFSSDSHFAEKVVERGFFVSFAGNLTYPSSRLLREAASVVPLSRLLLETDSPFLSPQSQRGKVNQPLCIIETAEVLAGLRGMPVQELLSTVAENFLRAFPKVTDQER